MKEGTIFSKRVIQAALSIPAGKVTTYGRLAKAAGGGPMAARSITAILAKAADSGVKDIPFHRIVYAEGRIWIDATHRNKRMKLYQREGIEITDKDIIRDFRQRLFEFL